MNTKKKSMMKASRSITLIESRNTMRDYRGTTTNLVKIRKKFSRSMASPSKIELA
jgi:hypothetical protein